MSFNNGQLGVAVVGGVTIGSISVFAVHVGPAVGTLVGVVVVTLILLYFSHASKEEREEHYREVERKSFPKSPKIPSQKVSSTKVESPVEVEPPQEKKSKKKSKKKKDTEEKPQVPQQTPKKSPKPKHAPQKQASEQEKEASKAQLKKKKKQEAQQRAREEEDAKREADKKRELAAQKKAQAKARKIQQQLQKDTSLPIQQTQELEDKDEDGWETQSPRKTGRGRDDKTADKKAEPTVAEFKIPARSVGLIIGKQGAQAELLRKLTNTEIYTNTPKGSQFANVRVSGDANQVEVAKKAILELSTKGFSKLTHPNHIANEVEIKDKKEIFAIRGPEGATVQKIQAVTGARIQIPTKDSASSIIKIQGTEEQVQRARAAIVEIMNQGYSALTHPDWTSQEFEFPSNKLGVLIGEKGATIIQLNEEYDVKIETPPKPPKNAKHEEIVIVTIKGSERNIDAAKAAIVELLKEAEQPPDEIVNDPNFQVDVEEPSW